MKKMIEFLQGLGVIALFVGACVAVWLWLLPVLPARGTDEIPVTGTPSPQPPEVTGTPSPVPTMARRVTGTPHQQWATINVGCPEGNLNFRREPGGKIMYIIPQGGRVQVIKHDPGGWSYVKDGSFFGYVWSGYLVLDGSEAIR